MMPNLLINVYIPICLKYEEFHDIFPQLYCKIVFIINMLYVAEAIGGLYFASRILGAKVMKVFLFLVLLIVQTVTLNRWRSSRPINDKEILLVR